jgi:hypothetical protein
MSTLESKKKSSSSLKKDHKDEKDTDDVPIEEVFKINLRLGIFQ